VRSVHQQYLLVNGLVPGRLTHHSYSRGNARLRNGGFPGYEVQLKILASPDRLKDTSHPRLAIVERASKPKAGCQDSALSRKDRSSTSSVDHGDPQSPVRKKYDR